MAAGRARLHAISKGAGIAALVLFVVTGATVAGIIGSNQHHGITPAAAAGLPNSSSAVGGVTSTSSASAGSAGSSSAPVAASTSPAAAVLAIAKPRSQGQPGIVPVPLAPRATAGPIPLLAWQAYHRAAAGSGCKLPWYVLAGIGKIESNHGRYGGAQFDVTGTVHPSIFGPPTAYGRAMGPMQFIPPTWASYATDGNNDDVTNPQNIFDATKAAAHYLCNAGGPDLSGLAAQRRAVFAYNHLDSYVADVLAFAAAYQHSQPERVVHLVPIVYPKPAVKVVPTTSPSRGPVPVSASRTSAPPTSRTTVPTTASSTSAPTSSSAPTSTTSAPPTSPTCTTTPPPTSATATSSAARAIKNADPEITTGPTSTGPARNPAARATSTATSTSSTPTCPPCVSTPTPTSSTSASATPTACPTSPTGTAPTTTATAPQRTPRSTQR